MATDHPVPLARFSPAIRPIDLGRAAISAAARVPEPVCVPLLLSEASLPAETKRAAAATARSLIEQLRTKKARGGVQALVQEYSLSRQEGVALMCLAAAPLRIPDAAMRDALLRDTISAGDRSAQLEDGPSQIDPRDTQGLNSTAH